MGLGSQLADPGNSITSWSLNFSHSTQRTGFVTLLKCFPSGKFRLTYPLKAQFVASSFHLTAWGPTVWLPPCGCVFVSIQTPHQYSETAGRQTLFQALDFG